jgi:6-phosphogluconate dehydrogenase (decarboxylating)
MGNYPRTIPHLAGHYLSLVARDGIDYGLRQSIFKGTIPQH